MGDVERRLNDRVVGSMKAINREIATAKSMIFDIMKIRINNIKEGHSDSPLEQRLLILEYLNDVMSTDNGTRTGRPYAVDNMLRNLWLDCAEALIKNYKTT